jgi:hypothetical protein
MLMLLENTRVNNLRCNIGKVRYRVNQNGKKLLSNLSFYFHHRRLVVCFPGFNNNMNLRKGPFYVIDYHNFLNVLGPLVRYNLKVSALLNTPNALAVLSTIL